MAENRWPLYVVSYGRAENARTPRELDRMGVSYNLVIEREEYDEYAENWPESQLLVVPERYHEEYDPFDNYGRSKPLGPGPARNFAWEHSMEGGHDWHWVMDDNIGKFYIYNSNTYKLAGDATFWRAMEDFCLRYENLVMAGPRYYMFVPRKQKQTPITFNSRVYSCNLIRNDIPYRWRGRYNEDTDLSLRILKDGWCTALFRMFNQDKIVTQALDGGNTRNFYAKEGTYPKSRMLKRMHPDVTTMTQRWGRWHHRVDYRPFKGNALEPAENPPDDIGDFTLNKVLRPDYKPRTSGGPRE